MLLLPLLTLEATGFGIFEMEYIEILARSNPLNVIIFQTIFKPPRNH